MYAALTINRRELHRLTDTTDLAINFCPTYGLLVKEKMCACGSAMAMNNDCNYEGRRKSVALY